MVNKLIQLVGAGILYAGLSMGCASTENRGVFVYTDGVNISGELVDTIRELILENSCVGAYLQKQYEKILKRRD